MNSFIEINNYIKKHLSNKRYLHSWRVMEMATEYAKIYGLNVDVVKAVALSHDLAKEFSDLENKNYIIANNLDKDLLKLENKPLIHGFIAADILEKEYSFTKEMGDAVRYHTTGRSNMTMLDKIIYLADKTEMARNFPEVLKERELAKSNLDEAMIFALNNSIKYATLKNKKINNLSIEALKFLEKNML